jgi:hypothetical protein
MLSFLIPFNLLIIITTFLIVKYRKSPVLVVRLPNLTLLTMVLCFIDGNYAILSFENWNFPFFQQCYVFELVTQINGSVLMQVSFLKFANYLAAYRLNKMLNAMTLPDFNPANTFHIPKMDAFLLKILGFYQKKIALDPRIPKVLHVRRRLSKRDLIIFFINAVAMSCPVTFINAIFISQWKVERCDVSDMYLFNVYAFILALVIAPYMVIFIYRFEETFHLRIEVLAMVVSFQILYIVFEFSFGYREITFGYGPSLYLFLLTLMVVLLSGLAPALVAFQRERKIISETETGFHQAMMDKKKRGKLQELASQDLIVESFFFYIDFVNFERHPTENGLNELLSKYIDSKAQFALNLPVRVRRDALTRIKQREDPLKVLKPIFQEVHSTLYHVIYHKYLEYVKQSERESVMAVITD